MSIGLQSKRWLLIRNAGKSPVFFCIPTPLDALSPNHLCSACFSGTSQVLLLRIPQSDCWVTEALLAAPAFLLVLPSLLYSSLARFEIVPALLTALNLARRQDCAGNSDQSQVSEQSRFKVFRRTRRIGLPEVSCSAMPPKPRPFGKAFLEDRENTANPSR
jgi:hypothetical protein